ncbi:MAG: peptide chain release factor N(5)-glutamine methyltransferase [Acidobacteriaceae bacterium]
MTLQEALAEAATTIPRREAETLLAHLLFRDRAWLIAHSDTDLSETLLRSYRSLIRRRANKEPIQYLTGHQEFYGLNLRVTRDTLIPRPETELLVEAVLHWIAARPHLRQPRVLDIGTGTGAIALALAAHLPSANITATDLFPAPLSIAQHNAARVGLGHRVHFLQSDLLAAPYFATVPPFDVIVSNPPYVSLYEAATMPDEVLHHEPHTALFAGPTGLDIYRRLIPAAHAALNPEGLLALEFGFGQATALRALFDKDSDTPWQDLRILDDYAKIPRIALAEKPSAQNP